VNSHRSAAGAVAALACLAACTQPVPVVDEASAPPLPEAEYIEAAGAGAAVFRIDPMKSLLLVRVGRAGKLGSLGHDHAVASEDLQGRIALYEAFERSHGDVVFPVRNLVVDRPEHRERFAFDTQPSADDIAGTYTNMLKVLDPAPFPWAGIRAGIVSGSRDETELAIAVTLHGTTFDYRVPAAVEILGERLVVSGKASVRHSEFGLEPYSAAGGLLRVADELGVEFRLVAHRIDAP
jgi:hypothetical protein